MNLVDGSLREDVEEWDGSKHGIERSLSPGPS